MPGERPRGELAHIRSQARRALDQHKSLEHAVVLEIGTGWTPTVPCYSICNKISYHNRMRECQFLDAFRSHGARFERVWSETDPADLAQVRSMKVDRQFARFTPEELAVTHTDVIMTFGVGTGVEPILLAGRLSPGVD